ncbi:hypothetical protein [Burkholderia lata]|uniref:hypothetical protein n=1 Tax=Burkholderia lata (strain ATCC 17760 / DSM 23089 / LMG 22485 / NCIMB 9086 / R18194 / 383) TaxID=482957 RepID=UPI0015821E55|nr:hypothetical protein [Burkholderia lata]
MVAVPFISDGCVDNGSGRAMRKSRRPVCRSRTISCQPAANNRRYVARAERKTYGIREASTQPDVIPGTLAGLPEKIVGFNGIQSGDRIAPHRKSLKKR